MGELLKLCLLLLLGWGLLLLMLLPGFLLSGLATKTAPRCDTCDAPRCRKGHRL